MNVDEILQRLKLDGWCIVPDVIPADKVGAVRESVQNTAGDIGGYARTKGVSASKGLLASDQSFAPYLADPRIVGTVEALFGPHVRISFTTAIINNPGNERGGWHSDWPFNQNNAGHVPAPYPDAVMHMTTLWMLSPFTGENGGTLIVPGSHRSDNNPTGGNGVDASAPYPTEMQATGDAGSVLIFDSRLWHAGAPNLSAEPRVGMAVRYAPWWLNLDVLMPGSDERKRMVDEAGGHDNEVPPVSSKVFEQLPQDLKPLMRHWVRD